MIIEFGNWQLRPAEHDQHKWELYHRHRTPTGEGIATDMWSPTGRCYNYSNIDNVILYTADHDICATDGAAGFMECYELLKETVDESEKSILRCLEAILSPANDSPR